MHHSASNDAHLRTIAIAQWKSREARMPSTPDHHEFSNIEMKEAARLGGLFHFQSISGLVAGYGLFDIVDNLSLAVDRCGGLDAAQAADLPDRNESARKLRLL